MANEILDIVAKVNADIKSDRLRRTALSTVLALHKPRIFDKGQSSDGSQIGTYSKAYGEKKSLLGRNPGYVNLRMTGQMASDYGLVVNGETYAFGFQNSFNADKADWLMDKYNKDIFHLSESELETLIKLLTD